MLSLIMTAMPWILQVAFWLLENFIGNNAQDTESRRIFLQLAKILREKGIRNVKSRFEAESQIDEANQEWDQRENGPNP